VTALSAPALDGMEEPAPEPVAELGGEPAPRGWYAAAAAGSLPLFVLGMVSSALADRLAFAGWGIVAGAGHTLLLRAAWQRGWSVPSRTALALGWGALALVSLAGLVERHRRILDVGYRAVLWPLYAPALTRPSTWELAAAALVVAALVAVALGRRARGKGVPS
jgi:hypothetical protein